MVVCTFNSSTKEAKTGIYLWVQGHPHLHREFQDSQGYIEWSCLERKTFTMNMVDFVPEIQIVQFIMWIDSGTEIIQSSQYRSRKIYNKTQHILLLKRIKKTRNTKNMFHYSKENIWQIYSQHYTQWIKLKVLLLLSGIRCVHFVPHSILGLNY